MIVNLFRVAFWLAAAIAFAFAVMPQPLAFPASISDKTQHMAAFFTLAVLGSAGYPRLSPLHLAAWLCAFGGLIELVQMIPSLHRDSDVFDWGVDGLAAVIGLTAVHLWRRAVGTAS